MSSTGDGIDKENSSHEKKQRGTGTGQEVHLAARPVTVLFGPLITSIFTKVLLYFRCARRDAGGRGGDAAPVRLFARGRLPGGLAGRDGHRSAAGAGRVSAGQGRCPAAVGRRRRGLPGRLPQRRPAAPGHRHGRTPHQGLASRGRRSLARDSARSPGREMELHAALCRWRPAVPPALSVRRLFADGLERDSRADGARQGRAGARRGLCLRRGRH